MRPKNGRTQSSPRVPRKRFRLERLEERIAPKKRTASPSDGFGGGKTSIY